MISHRVKAIVGFNLISLNTPPVNDAPFGCRKANDLRGFGVFHGSLDFDFQGVEAKIEMSYGGVYHRCCAVMFTVGERVGGERFITDDVFVGLAAAKNEDWEQVNGN